MDLLYSYRASLAKFLFAIIFIFIFTNDVYATREEITRNLFSQPIADIDEEIRLNFFIGRSIFQRPWVTAPASTQAADGLGPLYNARSCIACHRNNGRGNGPKYVNHTNDAGLLLLKIDIPPQNEKQKQELISKRLNNIAEPTYGFQLQNFSVPGVIAEYQLSVMYEQHNVHFQDGGELILYTPKYSVKNLGYGPLHPQARLSPRLPPQIFGLGLLEAIDENSILKRADPNDADKDGISGRPNYVWNRNLASLSIGRFGYKAAFATLNEQVQSAFSEDLGLSVPLFDNPAGDCTSRQPDCINAPHGNSAQYDDLEIQQEIVDLVNTFIVHLAPPARRYGYSEDDKNNILAGEKIFHSIGCQDCHTPSYVTSNKTNASATHHKTIYPYTDLLLHDMGQELADNRPEGDASGREWRTAPLWGIGLTKQVNGYNYYLHDGRARSLLEAILWHGGEAKTQRDAVVALDHLSRQQLIQFIESL